MAEAQASALYQHRGTRAVQRMVEYAPATGGLALWVHHRDVAAAEAPLVTTDGHTVFYGAAFERLAVAEQAGWIAHEVLHIALRHAQRYLDLQRLLGDVDLQLFNVCADAIVNSTLAHLSWLQLPPRSVQLDALLASALGLSTGAETALLEWDVERLYRAIDDRRKRGSGARQKRGAKGDAGSAEGEQPSAGVEDGPRAQRTRALGAPQHADLRPDAQRQGPPQVQAEETREWAERLTRAHAGDGVHSMLRTLLADLPRTRTPWEQVLRTQLARSLSRRPGLSWSRPTRSYIANQGRAGTHRLPWEPGVTPTRAVPRLVVIVDVSGSIEDTLMDRFAREIEALTRRLEAGLVLVIGDERVQRVVRCEPGVSELRGIAFQGGGGTDFTPLLEEAERHRPDITVVLTDLQGPAHVRPRAPVIWAVPEAWAAAQEPFGRKLVLS